MEKSLVRLTIRRCCPIAILATLMAAPSGYGQQKQLVNRLPAQSVAGEKIAVRTLDPYMSTEEERRLLERLYRPWGRTLSCSNLQQYAQLLNEIIPTSIDVRSLEEIGLSASEETWIDIDPRERVGSSLDRVLREHDLTWLLQGERLSILTLESAEERLVGKVYDITPLLQGAAPSPSVGPRTNRLSRIVNAIEQSIEPDTWENLGGPSVISGLVVNRRALLVVSSTSRVQLQVEALLNRINRMAYAGGGDLPVSDGGLPRFTAGDQ